MGPYRERKFLALLERFVNLVATLDADVQAATTVINDLVTALAAATTPVPEADQTALETAIAAGQAALAPPATTTETPPPAA